MRFAVVFMVACASQAKSAEAPMPPPSQCGQLADHVVGLMTASKHADAADIAPFKQVLSHRCTEDNWSAGAQKCLLAITSLEQAESCKDLLTQAQQEKLTSDGEAVSHRQPKEEEKEEIRDSAAPPPPPSPTRAPRKAGDPCEGGQ